jgi:hypothetical protein
MVTKKKKNNIILAVVIISSLILLQLQFNILPLASVPSDLDQYVGSCSGGWTTLSTSDVNIVGEGDRIRVFGVAKGSECLAIRLTESGLDSKLNSQGYDATKDVIGNIRLLEYSKTFPIDRIGGYKGNLNNFVLSGTYLSSATLQTCINEGHPDTIYAYKPLGGVTNVRCVIPRQQGIAGDFSAARSYGNFDVLFELGGYQTHLTREQQSVSIGNHRIEWTGNLLNLDQIYAPQYDARLLGSKWDLVSDGALNSVESQINSFISCMNSKPPEATPDSHFDYCDGLFDSRTATILQSKTSEYLSKVSNLVYDVSTDSNALYVSLKSPPYPAFILDLDAQSVGIVPLKGEPKIVSCIPNQDLDSGENVVVSFTIRNNADVNNVEFSSSIACEEGVLGYIPNFYIGANQQKTINAELIPSNPDQNTLYTQCNLEVRDLKSGNSDSCNFDAQVEYESGIICSPGDLSCSEDLSSIMKCTSDGKDKELYKKCEVVCIQDDEGTRCGARNETEECPPMVLIPAMEPIIKNDITIPDFICQIKLFFNNLFKGILSTLTIIKLLIVLIVFIFSMIFSNNLFRNNKQLRIRNKWIRFFITLLIGLFLGYLVFKLFWTGVIISAIVLVIIIILNFVGVPFRLRR